MEWTKRGPRKAGHGRVCVQPQGRSGNTQFSTAWFRSMHFRARKLRAPDARTVKAAIPPQDFYNAELTCLSPRMSGGWATGGLCPFHNDRTPGSFYVNLDSGGFNCFACGAKGGDIVAFLMQRDGLGFPDALAKLAREWRV